MPSYIIRNGKLQPRQQDFNTPNYRIIPYKSTINPSFNDYLTNTMDQLKADIQKHKQDYRNLIQTMWKVFGQVDGVQYDTQVMFMGLKCEEIYDKVSLIRSLNAYEPEEESLRLSAIMKVDDSAIEQQAQQSPQRSRLRQELKQHRLYDIQEEEECLSTGSHRQNAHHSKQNTQHRQNSAQQTSRIPSPKSSNSSHNNRLSLDSMTGQKRQSRRTSFFLRQKISIAFHEQQELRQLLEEELEKITQELDEKTECLSWTVDQLKARNQLIQRLKLTIVQRDQALEVLQSEMKKQQKGIDSNRQQQVVDEKDQQIGLLINSLIERTEETHEDFEFLKKSVQTSLLNNTNKNEGETQEEQQQQKKIDQSQSICLEELQNSIKQQTLSQASRPPSIPPSQQPSPNVSQPYNVEYQALKPKKMNFDSVENITYLTKQHFLQAERKSENFVVPNVKMTESVKAEGCNNNNSRANGQVGV